MAIEYRDIGILNGIENSSIVTAATPTSQIFKATHDGEGKRLPRRYRSFVSFSYGDGEAAKWIEDFDLVATIDGDRMTKNLTGDFEDLTSTYDVIDGQFYHSTHFRSNSLSFTLATDGIDIKTLEAFKNWFAPGPAKELILAEHPNRAIMARISSPPVMEVLPFEKPITINIAGTDYTSSVTEYRGTIQLEFIMDEPYWYSKVDIFGNMSQNDLYVDTWDGIEFFGASDDSKDTLKEVVKMIYEDGIPISSMITSPMLLGDNLYAASRNGRTSSIVEIISEETYNANIAAHVDGYYNNGEDYGMDPYYCGAITEQSGISVGTVGVIDGAYIKSVNINPISLFPGIQNGMDFYYAGSAPSPIYLKCTIPIKTDSATNYISTIASQFYKINDLPYNTITIESQKKKELRLTTPNFLTSYNRVIKYISDTDAVTVGMAWEDIQDWIRDNIRHPKIRALANAAIMNAGVNSGSTKIVNADGLNRLKDAMISIFEPRVAGADPCTMTIRIDAATGVALGDITYNSFVFNETTQQLNFTSANLREENIGDMLSSNHLIIEERNYFNPETFTIQAWSENARQNAHHIYHDFPEPLLNFQIKYRYQYY